MSIESMILSHHLAFCLQSFPAWMSFPKSHHFASSGQSVGASALASVLSMNIQGWFLLKLTGLLSFQSKGLSRVFFSTTVRKHQFFGAQPSLWSNSHVYTWLLGKPWLWLYGPLSAKRCLWFLISCLDLYWLLFFSKEELSFFTWKIFGYPEI